MVKNLKQFVGEIGGKKMVHGVHKNHKESILVNECKKKRSKKQSAKQAGAEKDFPRIPIH